MTALLQLDAVSKRHWRGHRAVDVLVDGSLELDAGQLGAVWGGRGAGKTTLLELAAGLQEPDAGSVLFDGRDIAQLSRREAGALLHTAIGIATRVGPSSRELSMKDWTAMALLDRVSWREGQRRAHRVLERVGAAEIVDEAWDDLSDGERTLASSARAIVREPQLLLVDDPSAGLGLLQRGEIMGLLRSIAGDAGVAVLMTAAEATEIQGAQAIWSLAGGRLTGGTPRVATVVEFPVRSARQGG